MRTRNALFLAGSLALLAVLAAADAYARKAPLLSATAGQLPSDTATDATRCSLEENAALGGKALKVVYAAGESFGDRVAKVSNWKEFIYVEFDAVNPSPL